MCCSLHAIPPPSSYATAQVMTGEHATPRWWALLVRWAFDLEESNGGYGGKDWKEREHRSGWVCGRENRLAVLLLRTHWAYRMSQLLWVILFCSSPAQLLERRSLLSALPLSRGRGGEVLTGGDCLLLGLPFIRHLQMWCMYCFPCKVNLFLQIMTVWKFSVVGCGTGERGVCIVSSQHQWCFMRYYKGLHNPKDSILGPLKL